MSGGSREIMQRARELFPGGVNSPVRAFRGVGGEPFVVERGEGARIWDADGREYIDYVLSWGPLVLGHAPRVVLDARRRAMRRGTSFGIPTEAEVELAELVAERMPHVEMLRFVSSGTEATMSAIRLARAATGRDVILKFDGCYHGHARLVSRARGLRRRDARPPQFARRARRARGADGRRAVQRSRRGRSVAARDTRSRRSSSSRWSETPGSSRRTRRFFPGCARSPTRTARCSSSTR